MHVNFFKTVEVDAWSRDFSYSEYLSMHAKSNTLAGPLSKDGYQALRALLENEMEADFNER